MEIIKKGKGSARKLQQELHAVYLACRDPGTPWYAKALGACVISYALSPIDLIPDFIPILGYVDELLLLPLGIAAVRRMIPPAILADCRLKAKEASIQRKGKNWIVAGIIIVIWIVLAVWVVIWVKGYFSV